MYVGADIGGVYDWDLTTVPQTQLDGAIRQMPQGKVLGGGSILNAMCWNRGGQGDFDAWEALGNPGWSWDDLLPYFMKVCKKAAFVRVSKLIVIRFQSETYTPVYSEEIANEYSINYNPAVHGTSGPVNVSYPKYFYPQSGKHLMESSYARPAEILGKSIFSLLSTTSEFPRRSTRTMGPLLVPPLCQPT